jgi:hypothetical protein
MRRWVTALGWALSAGLALAAVAVVAVYLTVEPLLLAVAAYLLGAAIVEAVRRSRKHPVPWWVAHVALAPWPVIVLLPWIERKLVAGSWAIAQTPLYDLDLPLTRRYHLVALIGFVAGTCLALIIGQRIAQARGGAKQPPVRVEWRAVLALVGVAFATFLLSFRVADRPITALWRLGGDIIYAQNADDTQRLSVLDLAPIAAIGVLLVAAAVRRRIQSRPGALELSLLGVLMLLLLGQGNRFRLYLLVFGWLLIQFAPLLGRRDGRVTRVVVATVICVPLLVLSSVATVQIAALRSGQDAPPASELIDTTVDSLDVVGTAEVLFQRVRPGELAGESYTQLPQLFLPRRFAPDKQSPIADDLVRTQLIESSGFSAPLWIEPVLNFGTAGALVFGMLYALVAVLALQWLALTTRTVPTALALLGPVWLMLSYQLLSRLTAFGLLTTFGSFVGGAVMCAALSARKSPVVPAAESSGIRVNG